MQSIHFLQPENQEGNILDLNNLQPVSEYQKQVVFDIVENGNKVDLDFLKNLNGFNFRNFNEFIQEDIDLVEYIIGRELLKSDFENSEFGGNQEKDLVYNLFVNICGRKRKVGLFFKDYLKNNLKLLYGTLSEENKVSNFFFEIGFEYKLEIIDGIKVLFGDSFSEKDIDTTLICTFYKLFNSFGKKDGIKKIAELFKGEITIENLKLYRNQFKNILSRFIGSFYDTTGESEIYDNIFYLRDVLGIDLKYSDFEKFYNSGLDIFFSLTHHNNKKINIFTIVEIFKDRVNHISEIFNSVDTINYLYELENNYFFGNLKILNNYFSLGKFSEFSTDFENGKYAFLLNYEGDLDKKLIDFLQEKGFLNSFEDFENLVNKRLFQNINFYIFKENFEYLEKQFGFKIEIENLSEYIILFLKYGNINNLEFIYSETLKLGFNISLYNFLSFLHFEGIEYRHYLSFISQPGLAEKVKYIYEKKGEDFDIEEYFAYSHIYKDIENLENNHLENFNRFLVEYETEIIDVERFKKRLDYFFKKYLDLDIENKDIFNFINNIGENIFLFEEFDISYDYFENENFKKFYNFFLISNSSLLRILIKNIQGIKFKNLFAIYKVNGYLFTGSFVKTLKNRINDEEYTELYINFFKYAITNQNYYFLENNLSVFTKSYKNKNINYNFGFEKIKEVLDKTGGFITKSLFENYVLQENSDLNEIWEKYQNAMRKVLSSEEIKQEELDDFVYEAIFMAYRPTGFSEEDIKNMIENGEIKDLTHQLDEIKFSSEGYELVVSKNIKVLDGELEYDLFEEYIERIFSNMGIFSFDRNSFDIKKFFSKTTEFEKLLIEFEALYSINEDDRIKAFREKYFDFDELKEAYDELDLLNQAYEIFLVVTKDSFFEYIIKELDELDDEDIKNIFSKMQKLKDLRFKQEFEDISNENITDKNNIKIEEKKVIIAKLTEKRIIEFGQFMRKKIKQELKKFKITRGEEKHFKAIISKNIGSFFAKAGAELCTANDKNMWNEQRHIHLNLIDEEKNQIVGNIMLYFEENRDYLIVRGFNPIRQIVNNYDNKQLVSEMIRVVKQIAKENGFDRVYIPKVDFGWHNLSNRDKIQKLVWNESQKNNESNDYIIENAGFYQTSVGTGNIINKLYLL